MFNEFLKKNPGTGKQFHLSAQSEFQKQMFLRFAEDCSRRKQTLIILTGQLNPLIGSRIDPVVREDMLAFLRSLRQEFSRVVLIDDCPPQSESDYDDLTHVNRQRQKEFTKFVGERLHVILPEIGNAH